MLVEYASTGAYCIYCWKNTLVYKVVVGNMSFYLCEDCGAELGHKLTSECDPPDIREL